MIDIATVNHAKAFVKWSAVFEAAGLNASTLRSKMTRGQELTVTEARAIERALRGVAITLDEIAEDVR